MASRSERPKLNTVRALCAPNETLVSTYGSVISPISDGSSDRQGISPFTMDRTHQNRRRIARFQERDTSLRNSYYGPCLLLENSGSVARDHLASERTYLAYVRTSLALASAGVGK